MDTLFPEGVEKEIAERQTKLILTELGVDESAPQYDMWFYNLAFHIYHGTKTITTGIENLKLVT